MKKFSFRLQPFLKLKEMQEKQKLHELAEINGRIDKNQQTIDFYYKETTRLYSRKITSTKDDDRALNIRLLNDEYLNGLKQKMQIAERENLLLQEELHKRQQALLQARKEKKVVEVVREKHLQKYNEFVKKEELKEIDDYNDKIKRYV